MDEKQTSQAEQLAATVNMAVSIWAQTALWLWSLGVAGIGAFLFLGDRYAGICILGSALLINPLFIKNAAQKAAEQGTGPMPIWPFPVTSLIVFVIGIAIFVN